MPTRKDWQEFILYVTLGTVLLLGVFALGYFSGRADAKELAPLPKTLEM